MPFNSLLLTDLVPKGEIDENGVGVALIPSEQAEEETMLLFKADKSDFLNFLREIKKVGPEFTPSCCDLVCFAHKPKLLNNQNKKCKRNITICLIELKSGENDYIKKAADQITQTYNGITAWIGISQIKVNITWKALVISNVRSLCTGMEKELEGFLPKIFTRNAFYVGVTTGNSLNLTKFMQKNEIVIQNKQIENLCNEWV